ncbi:hypothetical protein EC991_001220 [Linnemannia zychae]|nr:hypothetical protein EC991_001220 [Linnemannia zychae]
MRPIRIECWSCLRPSWLHRGQRDATPYDWTCPNCLTHQKRDKDGNIESVPEMFDSTLNEDTSERIARSRSSRYRTRFNGATSTNPKGDVFCDMCSGHQRVVYQLLSNYIPDEDCCSAYKTSDLLNRYDRRDIPQNIPRSTRLQELSSNSISLSSGLGRRHLDSRFKTCMTMSTAYFFSQD